MGICMDCKKALVILVEPDSEDEDNSIGETSNAVQSYTVDDDVELECGCHFHWQCLLDAYNLTECPNCGMNLAHITPSGQQQVLCNMTNEGGLQERLDILPLLTEESYLKAYPEERRCRAFLEFCGDGDIEAIVNLLGDVEDDETGESGDLSSESYCKIKDIIRYQDTLGSMASGLHAAILNGKVEVVWLLLFLASCLELSHFPVEVLQAAEQFGLSREDLNGKVDIRSLKDSEGLTASQRALMLGAPWSEWVQSGRLAA